jgi:hypothetical protein
MVRGKRGNRRSASSRRRQLHRKSRNTTIRHRRRPTARGRTSRASRRTLVFSGLIVAVLACAGFLTGSLTRGSGTAEAALRIVYTAATSNDAAVSIPPETKVDLQNLGLAERQIALTRVDSSGEVSDAIIDLTPRTGDSPNDEVLKVRERAIPVIDAKIAEIEATINSSPASSGDRALYAGLTKINFTSVPTIIISSGLDLASPDNFRDLNWSVTPEDVVDNVKRAGAQAALHGPVTFVVVQPTGVQAQLGQAQKDYRNAVWNGLLTSAGASSVKFLDSTGTLATSTVPAPAVPVPDLPATPIKPTKSSTDPRTVSCTLPSGYFIVNTPTLIDREKTKNDLGPCIQAAKAANATFSLDGWTSYDGPLNDQGRPAIDDPDRRALSNNRVNAVADLLITQLGVPPSAITGRTGHGNMDQPDPDPASEKNRVVVITYTVA